MAEPCWIVRRGESDEYANERHYLAEQEARDEAKHLTDNGEPATAEQLTAPCITLTCQGCGYQIDEDDEGIIHFKSIKQAHEYVLGIGEEGVVFAGDLLIRCCNDCPESTS
ncbi:hypothetical protein [Actinomadura sp. 21ATH]|uniref:hypothetical protein n=1 Tax=Actinomadura sp. 21ATH TaxID=1735444 RepID=UPI0035C23C01